jgi:hypothetical protein
MHILHGEWEMLLYQHIDDNQRRVLIDLRQAYAVWRENARDQSCRFAGSMRWREKSGIDYLFRKIGTSEKGLGRRSPETEAVHEAFVFGRERTQERVKASWDELKTQSAMARAIGLGRVPELPARILRLLDQAGLLGKVRIVGTYALFAYESLAGVHLPPSSLATQDIDLLLDARRKLKMTLPGDGEKTVLGLLQKADRSFEPFGGSRYRLANAKGFLVDLIRAEERLGKPAPPALPELAAEGLEPAPIQGLNWLVNCPLVETLVIDSRGLPAPIMVPDPRTWMLHKLWLSARSDRGPLQRPRDENQALLLWDVLRDLLPQYPLDAAFIEGLPKPLGEAFSRLTEK